MTERAQGRIVNVWTVPASASLTQDEAAASTVLHVDDASIFNDDGDGGWLLVGSQVVEYTDVDDDASTVTLAEGLTDAADEDDPVTVWSDLYGEADTRQWAAVQPTGKGDRADDIEALVDDGLELVDGDRGKRGEACTIVRRRGSDEWIVRSVRGRPKKARGMKAEANDAYTLTAADVTAGTATFPPSHAPVDESVKLTFGGVPQEPTNYTVDYDAATITFPLDGWEPAGLRFSVHYWYLLQPVIPPPPPLVLRPVTIGVTSTDQKPAVLVGGDLALSDESDATYAEQWLSKRAGAANGPTMRINFDPAPSFTPAEDCLRIRFQIMNEFGATSTDMLLLIYVANNEIGYLERADDTGVILTIPTVDTVYDWTEWVFVQTGAMTLQEGFAAGIQFRLRRADTIDEANGDFGVRVFDVWATGSET